MICYVNSFFIGSCSTPEAEVKVLQGEDVLSLQPLQKTQSCHCSINMAAMKMSLAGSFAPSTAPLLRAPAKFSGEYHFSHTFVKLGALNLALIGLLGLV